MTRIGDPKNLRFHDGGPVRGSRRNPLPADPTPDERRAAAIAERAAADAERIEQYAAAREAIELANAEKDRALAKAATTKVPSGVSATDHASATIDAARRDPGNRDLAAQAQEAAARAGTIDRTPCQLCGSPDSLPLIIPGHPVPGNSWACPPCQRGHGRADARALRGGR